MSTTQLFETVKALAEELNAWAAADCRGATYEDLLRINGDGSANEAVAGALARIARTVGLYKDGNPIKAALDEAGFTGDRLPVYVAALGGTRGKRVHDFLEPTEEE